MHGTGKTTAEKTYRVGVARLDIRLGAVERNMHRHDILERGLDRGKVLLHEAHRVVVELVREDDRPVRVVRAVFAAVDDRLVVGVDGVDSESRDFVVERVVGPDDGAQAESLGDVSARRGVACISPQKFSRVSLRVRTGKRTEHGRRRHRRAGASTAP